MILNDEIKLSHQIALSTPQFITLRTKLSKLRAGNSSLPPSKKTYLNKHKLVTFDYISLKFIYCYMLSDTWNILL